MPRLDPRHLRVSVLLPLCLCLSCAYRWSNLHTTASTSIALEAIYNTEARYVPHEHIWQAVQAMLARSGRLVAYRDAEQLLRLHLRDSEATSSSAYTELRLSVAVELWDLHRRRLLFEKTYHLASTYQTVFVAEKVPRQRGFMQAEANRRAATTRIGYELARQLRRDLLVTLD